jgi:hypothetical protein
MKYIITVLSLILPILFAASVVSYFYGQYEISKSPKIEVLISHSKILNNCDPLKGQEKGNTICHKVEIEYQYTNKQGKIVSSKQFDSGNSTYSIENAQKIISKYPANSKVMAFQNPENGQTYLELRTNWVGGVFFLILSVILFFVAVFYFKTGKYIFPYFYIETRPKKSDA